MELKASFISREIPVTGEVREIINESFTFNKEYKATCLTVGNHIALFFMNQVTPELAKELGPYVENTDEFPEKMNLQICRKIDTGNLDIEIWEREVQDIQSLRNRKLRGSSCNTQTWSCGKQS